MKRKEKMMVTYDVEKLYSSLTDDLLGNQKRIAVDSVLSVYYGISNDGYFRLSFMSASSAPKMESTKMLRVTQGEEAANVFWTCFDLLQLEAKKVFFTFCSNLIEAITGITDERKALVSLKKRYITWKTMFKQEAGQTISRECLQGLYGELYFLKNYMMVHYSSDVAIQAWSGPDSKSKDFSVNSDWYEVKTIGANTAMVKISSLAQLSSEYEGRLIIIRAEAMSEKFSNGESSVGELVTAVLSQLSDETIEELFINKLGTYGFDISDESFMKKFDVKSMNLYKVDGDFPRLTENDVQCTEICDVSYSLIVNSLKPYLEG